MGRIAGCGLMLIAAVACGESSGPSVGYDFNAKGFEGQQSRHFEIVSTACTIDTVNLGGVIVPRMTLTVANDEALYIFKRPSDGKVVANATTDGQITGPECTTTATAKLVINGSTGDNKVLIDFSSGYFGLGTSATAGSNTNIAVDLKGTTGVIDQVSLMGTTGPDYWTFGSLGGNVNGAATAGDKFIDVTVAGITDLKLTTGAGDDFITGMTSNIVAVSTPFAVPLTIFGGDGADRITSGAPLSSPLTNTLSGGAGNDTFLQQASKVADSIDGGDGADTLDYSGRTQKVTATLGTGSADDGESSERDDLSDDIETVLGGSAGDLLDATAAGSVAHVLIGNDGNDVLKGGALGDTLTGGNGDDVLTGGLGNDTMTGGAGVDTLDYSDTAHDTGVTAALNGSAGGLTSGGEADIFNQGTMDLWDIECLRGSNGPDVLSGNLFSNIIWGLGGGDTINGLAGNDSLYGQDGDDTLNGDDDNDLLAGGDGADTLNGGNGADLIDSTDSSGPVADNAIDCGADNDVLLRDTADTSVMNCELTP